MKKTAIIMLLLASVTCAAQQPAWLDTLDAAVKTDSRHIEQRLGHLQTGIEGIRAIVSPVGEGDPIRWVQSLPGVHDFAAFQASGGTAKTTVRTIGEATLDFSDGIYAFRISGNAFLYNMVRIIAGTLVEIGLEKRGTDAFDRAFRSLDRLDLGMTAPPYGLMLTEVRYPDVAFTRPETIRWAAPPAPAEDEP